jgi:hypothetical protein
LASLNRNPLLLASVIVLVALITILGLFIMNLNYTMRNPGGNDFLTHWVGTRMLITAGISPYSQQTSEQIHLLAYGRPARSTEPQLNVAYPLHSIILYIPLALIEDHITARAIWMTVLEMGLVLLAYLSLRLSDWKPMPLLLVFYFLFSLFFYHSLRPVVDGNAVIIVAIMITGGLLAVKNRADELAGVLFAFSTIMPQTILLLIIFILFWSIKQNRPKIAIWFITTVVLLVLSSMLIVPDWIQQNLLAILRFPLDNPPINLQKALGILLPGFGERIGWAISVVLVLLLIIEWAVSIRHRFRGFLFGALITLVATQWIGLPSEPGNFIILFPAIVVTFEAWSRRWANAGGIYTLITLLGLTALVYLIYLQTLQPGNLLQHNPVMFLPLPAFLFAALFWSRWWILQPANNLAMDVFKDDEPSFL